MAIAVISSYNIPSAVKLQIANLRYYNGDIRIIVADDLSKNSNRIKQICEETNVEYQGSLKRLGHYHGAQYHFFLGLNIAEDNVCFISQRFMVTSYYWIAKGEQLLADKGVLFNFNSQSANETPAVRTECIIFNAKKWKDKLFLFKQKCNDIFMIENYLAHIFDLYISKDDQILWPFLGNTRFATDKDWFSHYIAGKERYEALAKKLNVDLEDDFYTNSHYELERRNYKG